MKRRIHKPAWNDRQPRVVQEYERGRRVTANRALYQTAAWGKLRALFLADHPYCTMCGKPATVVDHIKPHHGDSEAFFDETNLDGLCKACHDRKTVRHDGGFGNAPRPV